MDSLDPPICTDEEMAKIQPLGPIVTEPDSNKQDSLDANKLSMVRVFWFFSGIAVGFVLSWIL